MSTRASRIDTAQMIQDDMVADAASLESMPFNGETVGPALGQIMAAIAGLAYLLREEMQAQQARVTGGEMLP